MKKNIAEDLPARQYPAGSSEKKDSPVEKEKERGKNPDDRVKKALDDIRYRSRREGISLLQAYSQYMQTSSMPQQEKMEVKQRLFGKEQSTMKAEDFNIQDLASSNVANALYKVFVENYKEDEPIVLPYIQEMENAKDRKYNVEVIDKDGTSYDRYATREKISKLRANPNIKDIVMKDKKTSKPYEGEKPERWWDDDGDGKGYEKGEVKEQFIGELADPEDKFKGKKSTQIGVMTGKNTIVMGPKDPATGRNQQQRFQLAHYDMNAPFISEKALTSSQKKFISMLDEKMNLASADMRTVIKDFEASTAPQFKGKSAKKKREMAIAAKLEAERNTKVSEEMECETDRKKGKDDVRSIPTDVNLRKNNLRAMGLKMSYEPEGEIVDEGMGLSVGAARVLGKAFSNPRTPEAQATKAAQKNITDPIGHAVKGAVKTILKPVGGAKEEQQRIEKRRPQTPQQKAVAGGTLNQSYEPEGEDLQENPAVKIAAGTVATYLAGKAMEAMKPKVDAKIKNARKERMQDSYEPEGDIIDERRRVNRGEPVRQSSPAVQFMKNIVRQKEGKPPGQTKKKRGGARQEPETPTQRRLRLKSQQQPESSRDVDSGVGIRGHRSDD